VVNKPAGSTGLGISLVGLHSELRGDLGIYVQVRMILEYYAVWLNEYLKNEKSTS
jgi:hypothetical protein